MSIWTIRKQSLLTERILHDGYPAGHRAQLQEAGVPLRKGAIGIVVRNPFVGRFAGQEELVPAMEELRPIALEMAQELRDALGGEGAVETFGKGAVVGAMGELEHAAMWHAPGGAAVRAVLGDAKAMVPAAKKLGNVGAVLDIPLHYIHASMVRSHYDVVPFGIPDGPKPNELMFALGMSTGGRVQARLGGLARDDATGADGLT